MERKALILLAALAVSGAALFGCGDTQTTATPDEQATYQNPKLEPPAGASNMGGPAGGGGAPAGAAPPPPPPSDAQAGPG